MASTANNKGSALVASGTAIVYTCPANVTAAINTATIFNNHAETVTVTVMQTVDAVDYNTAYYQIAQNGWAEYTGVKSLTANETLKVNVASGPTGFNLHVVVNVAEIP